MSDSKKRNLTPADVRRLKHDFSAVEGAAKRIEPKVRKELDIKIRELKTDLEELAHFLAEGNEDNENND